MASQAIQQQACLWYAARKSASDDVARSNGERSRSVWSRPQLMERHPKAAGVFVGVAEQTARPSLGSGAEPTTRPSEKRFQSFRESNTWSSGSHRAEGETELTARTREKRAQSFSKPNALAVR